MKYKMVLDLTTDRIIWYSNNVDLDVPTDEQCVISFYEGEIPVEMKPSNCWKFRLRDKKITSDDSSNLVKKSLLEQNRDSIKSYIEKSIFEMRQEIFPSSVYDLFVHFYIMNDDRSTDLWTNITKENIDSKKLQTLLSQTEKLKIHSIENLHSATTNDEIFKIKNVFSKELNKIKQNFI